MADLAQFDAAEQYTYHRITDDGLFLACYRTLYGNGRLILSRGRYDLSIEGSWCYPNLIEAVLAMQLWEVPKLGTRPPDGWFRELHTGLRRKDGDPEQEYFQP